MADVKQEWQSSGGVSGNQVLKCDGFYISYASGAGLSSLGIWGGDGGSDETALVKGGKFFILNGDYREVYERLVPEGFDACKRFYDQQSAHANSSWSDR